MFRHAQLLCTHNSLLLLCSGAHHDLHSFPTRRSSDLRAGRGRGRGMTELATAISASLDLDRLRGDFPILRLEVAGKPRSEEHTSELQSHHELVCRLLLEKKKYQM